VSFLFLLFVPWLGVGSGISVEFLSVGPLSSGWNKALLV